MAVGAIYVVEKDWDGSDFHVRHSNLSDCQYSARIWMLQFLTRLDPSRKQLNY